MFKSYSIKIKRIPNHNALKRILIGIASGEEFTFNSKDTEFAKTLLTMIEDYQN